MQASRDPLPVQTCRQHLILTAVMYDNTCAVVPVGGSMPGPRYPGFRGIVHMGVADYPFG